MINKRLRNLKFIPREIRGVTELRRNPSKVFEMAEEKTTPVLVTEFSEPKGVIISLDIYEDILELIDTVEEKEAVEEAAELADALDSVEIYRRERSAGKLRELTSLKDLLNEN